MNDNDEISEIWLAAGQGDLDIVKHLINSNASSVNAQDENGYTPLHAAVSWNHKDIVSYLLQHPDLSITLADNEGDTALHLCEDPAIAELLIKNGQLSPLLKNNEGQLSIQVAFEEGRDEMVAYLKQFTPDIELELEEYEDQEEDCPDAIQLDYEQLLAMLNDNTQNSMQEMDDEEESPEK